MDSNRYGALDVHLRLAVRRRDGRPDEEQYCADEQDARKLLDDLSDPDNAEMYRGVELVVVDWREHTEQVLGTIEFKEETT